jgi:hypothetical protein
MKRLGAVIAGIGLTLCTLGVSGLAANAVPTKFQMAKHPVIYFVMLDRFANGDAANDHGSINGGSSKDGFDPAATGFYHGGDLAGLTSKIGYIKSLGFTAIWVTPVVRQVTVAPDGRSTRILRLQHFGGPGTVNPSGQGASSIRLICGFRESTKLSHETFRCG